MDNTHTNSQLETELSAAHARIAELERTQQCSALEGEETGNPCGTYRVLNGRIKELERERIIKQTHIENLNDHIADLTAKVKELERLAQQNGDAWGACKTTINELHKRLAAAEADAARYQWLRDGNRTPSEFNRAANLIEDEMDAAIDLAAQEGKS